MDILPASSYLVSKINPLLAIIIIISNSNNTKATTNNQYLVNYVVVPFQGCVSILKRDVPISIQIRVNSVT